MAHPSGFASWETDELSEPPPLRFNARSLIGPGLVMVGANIGGGEWLFGPLVTAQYGGGVMWLATLAILLQVFYNLTVMRYALYCGEHIYVGFLRSFPGPALWLPVYLLLEFSSIWPYLASNAAVPLAAVWLGHVPSAADTAFVKKISYGVFAAAFVPLIFGKRIYDTIERIMVAKLVIVLAYLFFVVIFFVSWSTWWEIGSGMFQFGRLPEGDFNWATLAAFTAVAGAGGLSNATFSAYVREKGWGMGSKVGAIPSAVGGRTIRLSHTGKRFALTKENLARWKGWLRVLLRDQTALWAVGCMLGMALPAMFSYEFVRGVSNVDGNAVAAMSAQGIAARHGQVFWFLTLLCGFLIMAPTQVSQLDQVSRRWTDVIWIGAKGMRSLDGNKVKLVYYSVLVINAFWGFLALRITPNPLVLAIAQGVLWNFALAFTGIHALFVSYTLLPKEVRPPRLQTAGVIACSVLYFAISAVGFVQQWPKIKAFFSN